MKIKLKSGLELECLSGFEAEFLAADVELYFELPLALVRGATVLDVGANIGLFSARVLERLDGDARIFAFEPIAPTFEFLRRNLGSRIHALNFGLGAREEELDFEYFPALSGMSSSRDSISNERLKSVALAMIRSGRIMPQLAQLPAEMLDAMVESWLKSHVRPETVRARIRPLSAVIDEERIEAIDLLKIDVEGAELDVLRGIEARHWPRVASVLIELEERSLEKDAVRALLEAQGFDVRAAQTDVHRAGDFFLLHAQRG